MMLWRHASRTLIRGLGRQASHRNIQAIKFGTQEIRLDSERKGKNGEFRASSLRALLRKSNFRLFRAASTLSAIGDRFDLIAFPWLVLLINGETLAVGAIIAVGSVPNCFPYTHWPSYRGNRTFGARAGHRGESGLGKYSAPTGRIGSRHYLLRLRRRRLAGRDLIKLSLGLVFMGAGAMMALLTIAAGTRLDIAKMKMA